MYACMYAHTHTLSLSNNKGVTTRQNLCAQGPALQFAFPEENVAARRGGGLGGAMGEESHALSRRNLSLLSLARALSPHMQLHANLVDGCMLVGYTHTHTLSLSTHHVTSMRSLQLGTPGSERGISLIFLFVRLYDFTAT
jgi:hypothetical protein